MQNTILYAIASKHMISPSLLIETIIEQDKFDYITDAPSQTQLIMRLERFIKNNFQEQEYANTVRERVKKGQTKL